MHVYLYPDVEKLGFYSGISSEGYFIGMRQALHESLVNQPFHSIAAASLDPHIVMLNNMIGALRAMKRLDEFLYICNHIWIHLA